MIPNSAMDTLRDACLREVERQLREAVGSGDPRDLARHADRCRVDLAAAVPRILAELLRDPGIARLGLDVLREQVHATIRSPQSVYNLGLGVADPAAWIA